MVLYGTVLLRDSMIKKKLLLSRTSDISEPSLRMLATATGPLVVLLLCEATLTQAMPRHASAKTSLYTFLTCVLKMEKTASALVMLLMVPD